MLCKGLLPIANMGTMNMGAVILAILIVVSIIVIIFLAVNLNRNKSNSGINGYTRTNLTSNNTSALPAKYQDASLINAWGLAHSSSGPWLVSSTERGVVNQYDNNGQPIPTGNPLSIPIPPPTGGDEANPTGIVYNSSCSNNFVGNYVYFVATEGGTIAGISSNNTATTVIDNSASGAIYKGIALGSYNGSRYLFATNFHSGFVEVYNNNFSYVTQFTDPGLPANYAPFGIYEWKNSLYVTFALQDEDKEDDVAGAGNGFVSIFNSNGGFVKRLISNGPLNAPWGMAFANCSFGAFSNALLVGNFGDGKINAFDPTCGKYLGTLNDCNCNSIVIDGLWGIAFGNGSSAGNTNSLYFTAGPNGESNGLFGVLYPK